MNTSLAAFQEKIALIGNIKALLDWDQQCFMPPQGFEYRAEQLAYLAGLQHEQMTSPIYEDLLHKSLEETKNLSAHDPLKVNTKLAFKKFKRSKKLPVELVTKIASAASHSHAAWEHAKAKNDYEHYKPHFANLLKLMKEEATLVREDEKTLYDVFLDSFEPEVTSAFIRPLFDELRPKLQVFVARAQNQKTSQYSGNYDPTIQEGLCQQLAELLGFTNANGVLTRSTHPFSTTLGKSDFRITTKYDTKNLMSAFHGVAHEVGHSLYEQGLPKHYFGWDVGAAASFGVHESQSLFWEKKIATNYQFLKMWHEKFARAFGSSYGFKSSADLYESVKRISPGFIRIEADEVTYCLHIIIRFEIEMMMINENLPVNEVPNVWNQKYKDYLGIVPKDFATGCLQDIHWAAGLYGYFPSYALGHLFSSQFTQRMEKELGSLDKLIAEQKLSDIRRWLGVNIHEKGSVYPPLELIKHVTGQDLGIKAFVDYLEGKYS